MSAENQMRYLAACPARKIVGERHVRSVFRGRVKLTWLYALECGHETTSTRLLLDPPQTQRCPACGPEPAPAPRPDPTRP